MSEALDNLTAAVDALKAEGVQLRQSYDNLKAKVQALLDQLASGGTDQAAIATVTQEIRDEIAADEASRASADPPAPPA